MNVFYKSAHSLTLNRHIGVEKNLICDVWIILSFKRVFDVRYVEVHLPYMYLPYISIPRDQLRSNSNLKCYDLCYFLIF